jgi:hypothetical protein
VTGITGYRQLTADEIALLNEGKELGQQIGAFIERLEDLPQAVHPTDEGPAIDRRWLAIGKTGMQQALMAILRSIARPTTF